jgi:hypothetical protein
MEEEKRIVIKGKLQRINHKYIDGKFDSSIIVIEDKKDKLKEGTFYGLVPETLLGKKIGFIHVYKESTSELDQHIHYKKKGLRYSINVYHSNAGESKDFN